MTIVFSRKLRLSLWLPMLAAGLSACVPSGESDRDQIMDTAEHKLISAQFKSIAENAVSDGLVEGIQFALVEDGEVLSAQAYGLADREMNVPMTVNTPINVASISKPVTAWGLLAFAERSDIELNTSARNLLNDIELYEELFPGVDVSVRMLLSHTSGLSGSSVPVTPATQPLPSLTNVLRGKSSVPRPTIERTPGSGFGYSGAGYLVLQKIVDDQDQRGFAKFMATAVLEPAEMRASTYILTPENLDRVAVYYRDDGRRRDSYHLPGAAGGLYSTANDMARYMIMYTDSGDATRSRIISNEAFVALLSPIAHSVQSESENVSLQYALGHYTYETAEGVKVIFHAGGNPGLRAFFIVALDRNIGFFAVANNDRGTKVLAEMMDAWGRFYGLTLHTHN